jgi:hypothetical protein
MSWPHDGAAGASRAGLDESSFLEMHASVVYYQLPLKRDVLNFLNRQR